MNGIKYILRALHHGEEHLAKELVAAADRQHTEHEVHHVAIDLARLVSRARPAVGRGRRSLRPGPRSARRTTNRPAVGTAEHDHRGGGAPPRTRTAAPAGSAGPPPGRVRELPLLGDAGPGGPGHEGRTAARPRSPVPPADPAAVALDQHHDQDPVAPGIGDSAVRGRVRPPNRRSVAPGVAALPSRPGGRARRWRTPAGTVDGPGPGRGPIGGAPRSVPGRRGSAPR